MPRRGRIHLVGKTEAWEADHRAWELKLLLHELRKEWWSTRQNHKRKQK
jgi:hypothetical protein